MRGASAVRRIRLIKTFNNMNDENLRPFESGSSKAREAGRKGGRKSGATRRRNKVLREALRDVLMGACPTDDSKTVLEDYLERAVADAIANPSLNGLMTLQKILGEYCEKSETVLMGADGKKPELFDLSDFEIKVDII